ncbi:MAG TPA: cobalamin adenosyltransferase [Colwellia sp.]|nr:cobalamin adenosyltransferase [Colwellia sp.]
MKISEKSHLIHWQAANVIVMAAVVKAEELGIAINVAVVDSGGNLSAFLRMPHAFLHSIDIAKDKAYTSAGFRFPTSAWKDIFSHEAMLAKGMPPRDRLVVFGGGIPIGIKGMNLGGIGVSGGTEEEDIICAEAGLSALSLK